MNFLKAVLLAVFFLLSQAVHADEKTITDAIVKGDWPAAYDEADRMAEAGVGLGYYWKAMMLADIYPHPKGIPHDPEEGARLYELAAQRGVVPAMAMVSLYYEKGLYGYSRDPARAAQWAAVALSRGDKRSGERYFDLVSGPPASPEERKKYLILAELGCQLEIRKACSAMSVKPAAAVAATTAAAAPAGGRSVAYAHYQVLFNEVLQIPKTSKALEREFQAQDKALQTKAKELMALEKLIPTLSGAARKDKESEFASLNAEYVRARREFNAALSKRQDEAIERAKATLMLAIGDYAAEHGLSSVEDIAGAKSVSPERDVTQAVRPYLQKRMESFVP